MLLDENTEALVLEEKTQKPVDENENMYPFILEAAITLKTQALG